MRVVKGIVGFVFVLGVFALLAFVPFRLWLASKTGWSFGDFLKSPGSWFAPSSLRSEWSNRGIKDVMRGEALAEKASGDA